MYYGALLFCHLLIISTVEAGTGGVSFWRENFTMTCPESGTWFKKEQSLGTSSNSLMVDGKNRGLYHCEYDQNEKKLKYYFYVEGKVCANCFELDAALFGMFIVADVSVTIILMIFIYKCTKKKNSPGTKVPAGPAVPSPDYDHLSAHAHSQDQYSFINSGKPR
ncbi:T-cell surface glycoprotein CD3 epsilon chain-like isoform X2 [Hippocampus zosterae]|uniref:T-cell surface glycoprotein CD3 epsilon chain-like isoform X2 n=1 Tax=Hippocampus zosterae TaxID=109293 RepID=UPI00223DF227|nr:T-cell surface glycoprotein CD3 epsilon chain-like isoform X2 [Hippocampus zosterae]